MQEAVRKGRQKYMTKLKESILDDVTKDGVGYTGCASNNATDTSTSQIISNTGAITVSSDAYIYGIFPFAVQAIDVFRFFAYRQISFQASKKEHVKEQQQPIKPPK